jgi:formylglycine-generating enzyme required for sulfatase activity
MRNGVRGAAAGLVVVWSAAAALAQKPPTQAGNSASVFQDCAECPQMVAVPAGTFRMGTPEGEAGRDGNEGPQHDVTVRSFAIARSHVTRGQFAAFVRATGYATSGGCYDFRSNGQWQVNPQRNWRSPGFAQTDQHPVVCVSWNDAQAYVRWLSSRTGRAYRLPSEAEYEYAARAGTTTARFWGDGMAEACRYANVSDLSAAEALRLARTPDTIHMCRDGHVYTAPVASFQPNRFGLYDVLGNAWQWVLDCYNETYAGAPADGSAWTTGACDNHVMRGGSWDYHPRYLRAGSRAGFDIDDRYPNAGIRVAMTPAP